MATWDLDAARKERLRQRDPILFILGGQQFTCLPVIPLGVTWALADAPDQDELLQRGRPEVMKVLCEMIADMLVADDVDRWWALFGSKEEVIDDEAIYQLAQQLMEEYTGRPLSPSTDSSGGRPTNGASSSSKRSKRVTASSET